MGEFLHRWSEASYTTLGLFWMAFWAFGLGYVVSGMIQVFVTRDRMQRAMGKAGVKSVALGTFFGFISSSCSFAALATTRALFVKGAGLVPALAFMLASTNLVVELGIVIALFLGWQFVVAEYLGGLMLIAGMWIVVRATKPTALVQEARERAQAGLEDASVDEPDRNWAERLRSAEAWRRVAEAYVMEWKMVWKDVSIGFTVAGVVAAFVPRSFFETLFVGSESAQPALLDVTAQAIVAPAAAFFTFIGSMGNIPLAAVLFANGVSFAGVMAFVFSDLVVLPVLRIQARYYGWRMAFYILAVMLVVLVATSVTLHYGFAALGVLPDPSAARTVVDREFFAFDLTAVLNLVFVAVSVLCLAVKWRTSGRPRADTSTWTERLLLGTALAAYLWLGIGMIVGVMLD